MVEAQSTTQHEIRALILSFHPLIAMETVEEDRVDALLESVAGSLGLPLFEWTVTKGLRRKGHNSPFHGTNQPLILLKHMSGLTVEALFLLKDFSSYLENPEVRRQFREVCESFSGSKSTLVLTGESISLPSDVAHLAVHHQLRLPGAEELRALVRDQLRELRGRQEFQIDLGPQDLDDLLKALRGLTLKQARQTISYCVLSDNRLDRKDIQYIIERKGDSIREQGLLEYYPADSNRYELGGFESLRAWLERARVGFSDQARLLNLAPPKGILLVGVQGCGKSLAAKAVARSWNLPLLKLDAGSLYDKYVGESEKNFRKATAQAESMAPVVLWIDEIEKGFASTSSSEADGGLSLRILGSFLTWLQEKREDVFVVATANNIAALPPELLRKGRFDEVFFVDLPSDEERESIFEIHLRLRKQDPRKLDVNLLVEESRGFSGAEIEQAVIGALLRALHAGVSLQTRDLIEEIRSTVPLSISRREEIEALRSWARNRFVNAA